ncbi:hypothetical protein BEN51_11260 [Clostridium isatidis]|uniref:Uncharacterized protein n=1 Tax=Clostridium isatidis TaxID=182773 RepID=A0A343JET3_9CLOT|nr:hypothetical protein BEN51_11260 [Clostridium isatidis]
MGAKSRSNNFTRKSPSVFLLMEIFLRKTVKYKEKLSYVKQNRENFLLIQKINIVKGYQGKYNISIKY